MVNIEGLVIVLVDGQGAEHTAVAEESGSNIFITPRKANGELVTFEAEFYHLPSFAKEHGFKLRTYVLRIDDLQIDHPLGEMPVPKLRVSRSEYQIG